MILKIRRQHTAQVTLIEDDHVIETFAADGANDALHIGVLPRRSRCSDDLLNTHRLDTVTEGLTIGSITVSQQKARRAVPGEGLGHLAREPDLGRVLGDVKVNDVAAVVAEDNEDVEKPKGRSHNDEHVDGGSLAHMIVQK